MVRIFRLTFDGKFYNLGTMCSGNKDHFKSSL